MVELERVTLISVINKIKALAEENYENKVYDNVLPIFNELTTKEKRVLLRGLINFCFIIETKVLEESTLVDAHALEDVREAVHVNLDAIKDNTKTTEHGFQNIDHELKEIEIYNKQELIKLKSWLVKASIVVLGTGALLFIVLSFVFAPADTGTSAGTGVFTNILNVIKTIVGD